MTTIPLGFYENVFRFQRISAPRISTWTLGSESSAAIPPGPDDMAFSMYSAFTGTISPFVAGSMNGSWQFLGVTTTLMTSTGPLIGEHNGTITGGAVGLALVPNTAVLVTKNTTSGGRRNRGRAYIPPVWPPENHVDANGIIDNGELATLQSQYDAAFAALATDSVTPVLFHSAAPFTPTVIVGFTVQSLVATQRRRLRK